MTKLVILDRDGVINYDKKDYIKSPEEWHPIPGSLEAIATLNAQGFRVAVASNQSGIARGLFSEKTLDAIHQKMYKALAQVGGKIDFIAYCPHLPEDLCLCRKPNPGMLYEIARYFHCDLNRVPFVGDKMSDVLAAEAVGATPIWIGTLGTADLKRSERAFYTCSDLNEAVTLIIRQLS